MVWVLFIDNKRHPISSTIIVEVPPNATIDDLKKRAKELNPDLLAHADPSMLAVWRFAGQPTNSNEALRLLGSAFGENQATHLYSRWKVAGLELGEDEILFIETPGVVLCTLIAHNLHLI
jgi:hypothetical protein